MWICWETSEDVELITRKIESWKIESNLSKDELKALDELKKDQDIRILPADKGRIVVVLDTAEYKQKCENLLKDTATYKNLGSKDPTSKYKKELVNVLQELEKEGGINREEYRKLYPLLKLHLNSMGCRKCIKSTTHWDP